MSTELAINNITLKRGEQTLIQQLNAHFRQGQRVALIGNNGAGKSSLLYALAGLMEPDSGSIMLNQENLSLIKPKSRARAISFLQQHSPEQPYCLAQHRIAHGFLPESGFSWVTKEQSTKITNMAAHLSITHLLERPLGAMSGGEQRLIDIAKTLINEKAQLILLDEPSVFLDFTQKRVLQKKVLERSSESIIIFSSHDFDFIKALATDIIFLSSEQTKLMSPHQFMEYFEHESF